ncbi:MAG: hypothetical protein ACK5P7_03285 [Bdellovibrio sp.]
MQKNAANPRQLYFWMRVGLMVLALVGIFWLMTYFQSGEFEASPNVQGLMNPEGSPVVQERRARLVIETPSTSPTPAADAGPTKDR